MASDRQLEVVLLGKDMITGATESAGKGLGNFQGAITSTIKTIGKLTAAAAGLSASFVAFGIKGAIDFEKSMTNVSTLLDTTIEDMGAMSDAVLDIARRVPVSAGEIATSLYDIRSAGIAASDAMTVLEKSAQLGVAGLGTTKEAADLVTSSLNAFGLVGAEVDAVYGQIFTTVKYGKTTISELAQGFGAVAGVVASANIELPDYLAAVAALTTTGQPAAQAHTQLKAAIVGVTRESTELTTVLDALNVGTFKELIEKEGSMVGAFKAISDQVDGNDAAIIKLFGSVEAYNAVVQLSGDLNGAYLDTFSAMADGTSTFDDAFRKQSESTAAQLTILKNNFNVLAITIANPLLPHINTFIQYLTTIIQEKGPAIVAFFDKFKIAIIAVSAAFGGVLGLALKAGMLLWQEYGSSAGDTIGSVSDMLMKMGQFIGRLWFDIRFGAAKLWSQIGDDVMAFVDRASGFIKDMKDHFVELWNVVKEPLGLLWDAIKKLIEPLMEIGIKIGKISFKAFEFLANVVMEGLKVVLPPVIKGFEGIVKVLEIMLGWVNKLLDPIQELIDGLGVITGTPLETGQAIQMSLAKVMEGIESGKITEASFKNLVKVGGVSADTVSQIMAMKNNGSLVFKAANGGIVPGIGNRDTVPAMLTPGEEVLRADDPRHANNGGGININIGTANIRSDSDIKNLAKQISRELYNQTKQYKMGMAY